jgi:hypothetical protein
MTAPFDPAAWLRDFEAVRGWYVVSPEGRLVTGWLIAGQSDEALTRARRLWHVMADNAGYDREVVELIAQQQASRSKGSERDRAIAV